MSEVLSLEQKRVIALGLFDGVHLGHAALLRKTKAAARRLRLPAAALTFDPPPAALVTGRAPRLINTVRDRKGLIERLFQIDEVLVCGFDRNMMELSWQAYVEFFLCGRLNAAHIVCGRDHRFGYRGEGTADRLQALCARLGIGCDVIGQVERDGLAVSSTRIRSLLSDGDLDGAVSLLGHPHCLTGTVVHGKHLGASLGTPTANLTIPPEVICPGFGVYATEAFVDGTGYEAVTNIGVRPTVDEGGGITCEPWLLDFHGDLYGREIRIEFHRFLRPERKFADLGELRAAIMHNAQQTRDYFRNLRNFSALLSGNTRQ
ncbi:MAG: riboflavin biosynthesis protein RibF [Oscillospiraceae bacterium]|nr:riboflavin biosynthesis protein RibF [Oscillospiraceae bacterium]